MIKNLIEDESLQGWIFDLDGVITDTAKNHYLAWKKLADEENLVFNEVINEKLRGVSRRASLEIILNGKKFPEEKILQMMERKNGYYRESLNSLTSEDILPGILPLLDKLKERGKKLAIGSASRNTEFILKHLDIRPYFDGVATGALVIRAKPAPDVFIHAAGQIGLAVENCIVLEDAEAGVTGAKSAGFKTIGIGPEERVGHADFRLDSTEEFIELISEKRDS
jgi:beta-phosphoglucomutase